MKKDSFSPQLDPSAYYKAGNTGLKNWQALNEIIANSIDSWIDTGVKKDLIVKIDLKNQQTNLKDSSIRITDNAAGMEKDELINLFSFFRSTKSSSKFADEYLGLYGFGFKAATSKLGTNVTVITSSSSKEFYKINVDYVALQKKPEAFNLTIETVKHDNTTKKMFNGGPTGTIVDISNFNSSFPEAVLYDWLPVSWKKYMNGEIYEKKLKLYVGEDVVKSNQLASFSLELDESTMKEINVSFEWVDNKKKKQKGTVQGFFGFKTDKKLNSMAKQGLNVYRRGQLIERYNKSLYMDGAAPHNSHNVLVGEINIEINVNTVKNAIEDSDANDAMSRALNNEFKKYKNSIKNMNIAVATDDRKIIDLEIAKFRKEFDLKLNAAQKKILNASGTIEEPDAIDSSDSNSGDTKQTTAVTTKKLKKVPFKMLDWNKFKLEKIEYAVEFIPYNIEGEDGAAYSFAGQEGETIKKLPVLLYLKHPKGIVIEKALKNKDKNEASKLICSLLVAEATEKLMNIHEYSKKEISIVKNIVIGE